VAQADQVESPVGLMPPVRQAEGPYQPVRKGSRPSVSFDDQTKTTRDTVANPIHRANQISSRSEGQGGRFGMNPLAHH